MVGWWGGGARIEEMRQTEEVSIFTNDPPHTTHHTLRTGVFHRRGEAVAISGARSAAE